MKIELKNVKVIESMSEETNCYTASLYVDGKKIGIVSNRGHGGCDEFNGDWTAFEAAQNWLKSNHEEVQLSEDMSVPMDMELFCGEWVENWRVTKSLKKDLKSKVLFTEKGKPGLYQLSWKGVRTLTDRHIDHAKAKHPNATILNTLPLEKALEIYKKAA